MCFHHDDVPHHSSDPPQKNTKSHHGSYIQAHLIEPIGGTIRISYTDPKKKKHKTHGRRAMERFSMFLASSGRGEWGRPSKSSMETKHLKIQAKDGAIYIFLFFFGSQQDRPQSHQWLVGWKI